MTLERLEFSEGGIFGRLLDEDQEQICRTLEHAYPAGDGGWFPKIPLSGVFLCVRGVHQLSGSAPFETFEVTGIEGHTGILFHPGNRNCDSSGCILLGQTQINGEIVNSREAFENFMNLLEDVDSFELLVH